MFDESFISLRRRLETTKIGGEGSATCRGCAVSHFAFYLSSATSAGCATFSKERGAMRDLRSAGLTDHFAGETVFYMSCGLARPRPHPQIDPGQKLAVIA